MSPAASDVSTRSWTSLSIRSRAARAEQRELVRGQVARRSRIPKRIASSMSWLMYATRSTIRTIFPSCVSGSSAPVCLRIPSRTSDVRLSRSAIRSDCSLWRKPPAEALAQALVERLLARVAERRVAHVVAEADRLRQVLVQAQRPGDAARDPGRLERVRHARAVVVAGRVDEDLRLALQPPERLRVEDPVAVALERRPQPAFLLLRARPRARTSARPAGRATTPPAPGSASNSLATVRWATVEGYSAARRPGGVTRQAEPRTNAASPKRTSPTTTKNGRSTTLLVEREVDQHLERRRPLRGSRAHAVESASSFHATTIPATTDATAWPCGQQPGRGGGGGGALNTCLRERFGTAFAADEQSLR